MLKLRFFSFKVSRLRLISCLVFASTVVSLAVNAKTDVAAKQEQLKENVSAAKSNLAQYESNLRVVTQNISEVRKAIKTLKGQSAALAQKETKSGSDQKALAQVKNQVEGFLAQERTLKDMELRQMEELKALLARLEANQVQRDQNIAAYQEQLTKLGGDGALVQGRAEVITELKTQLSAKSELAETELKELLAKKSEYEVEIEKWKKQVRISERAAQNFSKLKSP